MIVQYGAVLQYRAVLWRVTQRYLTRTYVGVATSSDLELTV